jgi:hypothetical protein
VRATQSAARARPGVPDWPEREYGFAVFDALEGESQATPAADDAVASDGAIDTARGRTC